MGKWLVLLGFPCINWQKKERFRIPWSLARERETQLCAGELGV